MWATVMKTGFIKKKKYHQEGTILFCSNHSLLCLIQSRFLFVPCICHRLPESSALAGQVSTVGHRAKEMGTWVPPLRAASCLSETPVIFWTRMPPQTHFCNTCSLVGWLLWKIEGLEKRDCSLFLKINVCLIFFLSSQYVFRSSNQSAFGVFAGTSHITTKATTIS